MDGNTMDLQQQFILEPATIVVWITKDIEPKIVGFSYHSFQ
jgi:hypothetical protein